MKNLSQILEEKEELFEKIWARGHIPEYADDTKIVIKSLLSSSLRSAVEEALKECRPCSHANSLEHSDGWKKCLYCYDEAVKDFLK